MLPLFLMGEIIMSAVLEEAREAVKDYFTGLHPNPKKYSRMLYLRSLVNESVELSGVDIRYLNGLLDAIVRPNYCIKYWMNREELDKKIDIVKKYNLTEEDVRYMIHYKSQVNNIR